MLVLALQFSKGGRRGPHMRLEVARGTPWAAGAVLRAIAEVDDPTGRLPQNGREDKVRRAGVSRGRILRLTNHFD